MRIEDTAMVSADPAEISDHLLDTGLTAVTIDHLGDAIEVTAAEGDAAIETALTGFAPTTSSIFTWTRVPPYVKDHIQHLRDYRDAVRNGQSVTNAQTTHVIADIIDALRYVNAKITGD